VGLFELLVINDQCRELVQTRANASQIRDAAVAAGMRLLSQDGIEKVRAGATTMAEVLRATSLDSEALES
jgi:type II secretory ATPase GspE/PulE/Tfp pilus assembly ATPase PilB-like protein